MPILDLQSMIFGIFSEFWQTAGLLEWDGSIDSCSLKSTNGDKSPLKKTTLRNVPREILHKSSGRKSAGMDKNVQHGVHSFTLSHSISIP